MTEQFQEKCCLSVLRENRLLVVAASGKVVHRAWIFRAKLASHELQRRWGEVHSQAISFSVLA